MTASCLPRCECKKHDEGMEAIWRKIEKLGITEADIADAVRWARGERQGLTRADRVLLSSPLFWAFGGANALPATFSLCLTTFFSFQCSVISMLL